MNSLMAADCGMNVASSTIVIHDYFVVPMMDTSFPPRTSSRISLVLAVFMNFIAKKIKKWYKQA